MNEQSEPHGHEAADRHVCRHGAMDRHHEADVICVDHVSFAYGTVVALSDVTLHVERGCNLGIVGPNGGGKTTLLKIMLGLLDGYTGSVRIDGLDPATVCRRGDVVGYVPQHHTFERRFPVNVGQVVRMGLTGRTGLFGSYRREDRDYVEHLMALLGVADLAMRPIGHLSGGQQQRAFIARALAGRPVVLLLDEPTVGVDVAGQKRFAELIHTLHDQLDLTIIVVSHDLRAIAAGCGKVAVLNRTLHYHDAPDGLTADLLHEVFRHDILSVMQ